jgi:excinuclease ABC subunit C
VTKLEQKLAELPKTPGVYFHKNARGQIIYIGKAANLRNRVRQYFQKSRTRDAKTDALVAEIADIDWTEVETELDALFLEAELVRRYLPPYNILLRDDKSLTYVRISYSAPHPTVSLTRRPLDDGAQYFGPYFSALSVKKALKYLRRIFPYSTHWGVIPKRACLQYHLGLCPGLEEGKTPLKLYRANLKKLMQYLKGERVRLMQQTEKDMRAAAKAQDFETAAIYRNQLHALKSLSKQVVFGDREFMDISKDQGLVELTSILGLAKIPRRIEGYDISHMQGTDTVASMVVFKNGIPDKAAYRKFKMRLPGNDDFAHMNEAITRRLREDNRNDWGVPDLFLIDGGKGQLSAAIKARQAAGLTIPMIGLAKRDEEIIVHLEQSNVQPHAATIQQLGGFADSSSDFSKILLPQNAHVVKLLQRIRDESHRFAVSYHSVLKVKRQTASLLDDIPTIGPATRKKLIKTFGSMRGLLQARDFEVERVVGTKKAAILKQYLRPIKRNRKTTV